MDADSQWLPISFSLSPNFLSPVATEQFDQGRVPSQPFLLALCGDCNPGHHVHELRPQHGPHHQDPGTPAVKVRSTRLTSSTVSISVSFCGLRDWRLNFDRLKCSDLNECQKKNQLPSCKSLISKDFLAQRWSNCLTDGATMASKIDRGAGAGAG